MAELDIKGFVTPEQEFPGIYKLTETLAAQKAAKAKEDEAAKAQKTAMGAAIGSLIDSKDFMTGTVNDPYITKRVYDLIQKGTDLSNIKGMDLGTLRTVLLPEVSKLSQAAESIKEIKRKKDEAIGILKSRPGVDTDKFSQEVDRLAYYNKDDKGNYILKNEDNISSIDPTYNYIDDVLNNADVYNEKGINEYLKNIGKNTYSHSTKIRNAGGTLKGAELEVSSPTHLQPISDTKTGEFKGFEPPSTLFTDGGEIQQIHSSLGDTGEKLKQPVKLLADNEYNQLMNDINVAPFIRQETRKYAKQYGVDLASSQAEAFSKALAFDYLNRMQGGQTSYKVKEQQLAPVTKLSVNMGGAGDKTTQIRDIYKQVIDAFENEAKQVEFGGRAAFIPMSRYEEAGTIITDIVNKRNQGRETKYNADDLYIVRTGDMKGYEIRDTDGNFIMPFNTAQDINPKANYGTKLKQKAATTSTNKSSKKDPLKLF